MDKQIIAILIPVFNDWSSFKTLVDHIDQALSQESARVLIIGVDDGSTEPFSFDDQPHKRYQCIERIEILQLIKNMGHQRAIAIGLSYIESLRQMDTVVIMDADGEDRPEDLPVIIKEQLESGKIVFAQRGKRYESKSFIAFYTVYRSLLWLLTGQQISFGNFCAIPKNLLKRVTYLPEIWNHFAAGVMRSGLPSTTLRLSRGTRYRGKSKMNFVALVMHGLSAISIYTDILAIRMLLFTVGIILLTVIAGAVMLYTRYFTSLAIPGWATNVGLGLGMILFQSFILLLLSVFIILNFRSGYFTIPFKIFADFIWNIEVVHEQA